MNQELIDQIETNEDLKIRGDLEILEHDIFGKLVSRVFQKNVITVLAKTNLAAALRGESTPNRGVITYCAVGTSGVAPTANDTQLTTEIFRKQVSVRSNTGNQAIFQTLFNISEANGTLLEAGLFGLDASTAPNSGALFSKIAINRVKSSSNTLTFNWTITIG